MVHGHDKTLNTTAPIPKNFCSSSNSQQCYQHQLSNCSNLSDSSIRDQVVAAGIYSASPQSISNDNPMTDWLGPRGKKYRPLERARAAMAVNRDHSTVAQQQQQPQSQQPPSQFNNPYGDPRGLCYNESVPTAPYSSGQSLDSSGHQQYVATASPPTQMLYASSPVHSLPPKGKIHSLIREESRGIPIPGRTQSHDDIHLLGGNSPRSPGSGRYSPSKFIICGSPGSPPMIHYGTPMAQVVHNANIYNNNTHSSHNNSQTASPLSSSVPTGGGVNMNRLALKLTQTNKKNTIFKTWIAQYYNYNFVVCMCSQIQPWHS